MADDIVERLRAVEECLRYHDCFECGSHWGRGCACLCHKAVWCGVADAIERLLAAGDALAKQVTRPCRCVEAHDGSINETCAPCAAFFDWQEARRG